MQGAGSALQALLHPSPQTGICHIRNLATSDLRNPASSPSDFDRIAEVGLVWDKVVEIEDLDRIEAGRKGVVYNKKRPLIVDQEASE